MIARGALVGLTVLASSCTFFVPLEGPTRDGGLDAGPRADGEVSCAGGGGTAAEPRTNPPAAVPSTTWPAGTKVLPAKLPVALHEAAVAFDGTSVWLFGGLTPTGTFSREVLRFDPRTETLSQTTYRLPFGRQASAAIAFGGAIYLFGGRSSMTTLMTHVVRFEPSTGVFTPMRSVLPSGRYNLGIAAVGNRIYLFGGNDYSAVREILEFDPVADSLQVLPAVLAPGRESPVAFEHRGSVFLVGGSTADGFLTTIERFEPRGGEVRGTTAALPRSAWQPAWFTIDGVLYLYGGDGAETVTRFDPATERAMIVPNVTIPHGHMGRTGIGLPGRAYVFGGGNATGTVFYDTIVRFVP